MKTQRLYSLYKVLWFITVSFSRLGLPGQTRTCDNFFGRQVFWSKNCTSVSFEIRIANVKTNKQNDPHTYEARGISFRMALHVKSGVSMWLNEKSVLLCVSISTGLKQKKHNLAAESVGKKSIMNEMKRTASSL